MGLGNFRRTSRRRHRIQQRWTRALPVVIETTDVGDLVDPQLPDRPYVSYFPFYYEALYNYTIPISAIHIDTEPEAAEASTFPMQFDLRKRVRRVPPIREDFEINLLSVEEFSLSENSQRDNPAITLDREGRLTYRPQGNFLRNVLLVRMQVVDPQHPTPEPQDTFASTYPHEPDSGSGSRAMEPVRTTDPEEETIILGVKDDVIGNPDEEAKYWNNQGANGTCVLAAIGSALESAGITTFEEVLHNATIGIDADGRYVLLDTDLNPLRLEDGSYKYIGPNDPFLNNYINEDGKPLYVKFLEEVSPEYREKYGHRIHHPIPPGTIYPNPEFPQGFGMVKTVFDYYGVDSHTGYASDFTSLISELAAGNKIVAVVDAKELWRDDSLLNRIVESGWVPLDYPETRENHLLWITGIRVRDGEAFVIVNDSGDPTGRSREYELKKFAAAFEDGEFMYQGTGKAPPVIKDIQAERTAISTLIYSEALRQHFADERGGRAPTFDYFEQNFNTFIERDDLIAALGLTDRVNAYKRAVETNRKDVLEKLGLDPDEIQKIFDDVDVE